MASRPTDPELDPRARQLLRTLIARYIRDGEPVGSQTLARHAGLDISPATIRNILADLEEGGLLTSPHTSAGRVPTTQGYRVFVDSLLQVRPLPDTELARLRQELPAGSGTQALLGSASELLSAMTHFVGVVGVPRREQFAFRHIDFVQLGANRLLVILVFTDHEVQNRVIETSRTYAPGELEQIANYLGQYIKFGADRTLGGMAGQAASAIRKEAYALGVAVTDQSILNNAQYLVRGLTTMEQITGSMREQAAGLYPAFAGQVNAGANIQDLAQPYVQVLAQKMGLPVTDI